jgi:hypothetical protein
LRTARVVAWSGALKNLRDPSAPAADGQSAERVVAVT